MKFSTPLLLVAAASSAVYGQLVNEQHWSLLSEECKNQINSVKEYVDCTHYQSPKYETIEEDCNKMTSPECKAFYENPMSYFPKCEGTDLQNYFTEPIMKTVKATVDFICAKDEEGEMCPLAEIYVRTTSQTNENVYKYTCHSKNCIDTGIAMYSASFGGLSKLAAQKAGKNGPPIKNGKQEVVEKLQSQECLDILAGKIKVEKPVITSDTTTNLIKLGSTLVISLDLLLYLY